MTSRYPVQDITTSQHKSTVGVKSTPASDHWTDRHPVVLPSSAPIPQQHWTLASNWIPVVGRDLVACLFSRDWMLRESALYQLWNQLSASLKNLQESKHSAPGF